MEAVPKTVIMMTTFMLSKSSRRDTATKLELKDLYQTFTSTEHHISSLQSHL